MKVLVSGALGQRPRRGGHAWVLLHYLLGLRRLGCDVRFVDRLEPDMCVDGRGAPCPAEESANLAWVARVLGKAELGDAWAVLVDGGTRTVGIGRAELLAWARGAELLVDVMGYLHDEELMAAPDRRLFLDIDPGFPQLWAHQGLHDAFGHHDVYATYGANIGDSSCNVPTCGIDWVPTRPPVVLEHWPVLPAPVRPRVTSVGSWRGPFAPVVHEGRRLGLRAHSMRALAGLPAAARRGPDAEFELALDIDRDDAGDVRLLAGGGWRLVDPQTVAGTPVAYRRYVQGSSAELLVPKELYLRARTGWCSDRSACYLATGRPVLALDPWPAGSGRLPAMAVGKGLVPFADLTGAAEAVAEVFSDYEPHRAAARALAEEHFDSDRVLARLLDDAGRRS